MRQNQGDKTQGGHTNREGDKNQGEKNWWANKNQKEDKNKMKKKVEKEEK